MFRKKLALSLSGGGAKSMIYLGIIRAFRDNDIPIDFIGGLSGGSLIAAMLGVGMVESQIFEIVNHVHTRDLIDLNPMDGMTILDQDKVYQFLNELFCEKNIEDCSPQVVIFATDYDTKEQVVLRKGNLAKAVMGSGALFPLLPPIHFQGRKLIEGGWTTHYGANYFREFGANVVIGADVNGFANVSLGGMPEVVFNSIDATIEKLGEYEVKIYPVDDEIAGFEDDTGMFEFSKISQKLVDIGYKKATEHIPHIKSKLALF